MCRAQESRHKLSGPHVYNYLCPLFFLPLAMDSHYAFFDIELRLYFLQGASLELGQSPLLLLWASPTPKPLVAFAKRQ